MSLIDDGKVQTSGVTVRRDYRTSGIVSFMNFR